MTHNWTARDRERFLRATGEPTESGCIPWARSVDRHGYGYFSFRGKLIGAHRAAFEMFVGPIPDRLTLDHTCHSDDRSCSGGSGCTHRRCVNTAHLEPVTQAENSRRAFPATKTHCTHSHEYTAQNTYIHPSNGRRDCRTCIRERARRYSQRRRQAS